MANCEMNRIITAKNTDIFFFLCFILQFVLAVNRLHALLSSFMQFNKNRRVYRIRRKKVEHLDLLKTKQRFIRWLSSNRNHFEFNENSDSDHDSLLSNMKRIPHDYLAVF